MKKYPFYHILKIGDKILVFLILLFSISSFFIVNSFQSEGNYLEIQVEGQVIHKLSLKADQQITVDGHIGQTIISIKKKKAEIIYSDCPHKICVKTGAINRAGQVIVCVPNRVFVQVLNSKSNQFDVIVE